MFVGQKLDVCCIDVGRMFVGQILEEYLLDRCWMDVGYMLGRFWKDVCWTILDVKCIQHSFAHVFTCVGCTGGEG